MKRLKAVRVMLRLIMKENPSSLVWLVISGLLSTFRVIFIVSIPKLMIDGFLKNYSFLQYVQLILIIAGVKLLLSLLGKWVDNRQLIHQEIMRNKYLRVLSDKVMSIDYAHLEDPAVLELREAGFFALSAYRALDMMFQLLIDVASGIFTLLTITALLIYFSLPIFLLIFGLTAVSTLLSFFAVQKATEYTKKQIPINRVYNYYFGEASGADRQKEYRMYDLGKIVVQVVKELNSDTAKWVRIMKILQANTASLQMVIQSLITLIVMVFAAYRTQGQWGDVISVADFTFFVGIAVQFSTSFESALRGVFGSFQALDMLQPLADFMEIPDSRLHSGEKIPGSFENLEFNNVSFRYPQGDRQILENISFRIENGEHISIVGVNNAGKTTIVKLICRLFEPDEGEILYNGISIKEYDYQAWLRLVATVFQDFQFLPLSLKENLSETQDDTRIMKTLEMVGMKEKIEKLPQGLDSQLNKFLHEDAVEFSGGEKQKLAIARSILKEGELIILDEPTAALDPFAESEIYEHFSEMVKGKTTIFISHRMSSSLFCDKILLLDGGKVAAFDSHKELMKTDNMYRTLFLAQAQHYKNESENDLHEKESIFS